MQSKGAWHELCWMHGAVLLGTLWGTGGSAAAFHGHTWTSGTGRVKSNTQMEQKERDMPSPASREVMHMAFLCSDNDLHGQCSHLTPCPDGRENRFLY